MIKILFLSLVFLCFNSFSKEKTIINADKLESNKLNSTISAKGNVKLTRNKYKVFSDEVLYDKKKIYLKSRTKLIDTNNNSIFADEAEVTNDMLYGEFKNAGIILSNGITIISPKIIKENDERYYMENPKYYFCSIKNLNIDSNYEKIIDEIKKNKKQIFSIKSKKSTIDKKKSKIYFNHAIIRLFDIPIMYIPYISTSRPFKNNNGFSVSSLSISSKYGYSIYFTYTKNINDSFYYRLKPRIFQKGNILLENKIKNNNLEINFNFSYDNGASKYFLNNYNISEKDESKHKNNRFYFNLYNADFINKNLFFNININFVNDLYFLRDYYDNYEKTLQSTIDITKIGNNYHFAFDNVFFQEIRERKYNTSFNTINYVPTLDYYLSENITTNNNSLIDFNFKSRFNNIFIENDNNFNNIYVSPQLKYSYFNRFYFDIKTSLNIDSYNYYDFKNNYYHRINPELELNFALPIYFYNFLIKPKIQYFLSDYNNKNNFNFDSYDSELNINNIFSSSRYSGYNLIEKGNRINYAIESDLTTSFGNFNFIIAQAYRDNINKENKIINFENNLSNILTNLYFKNDKIYINYSNIINKKNYNINRTEILIETYFKNLTFNSSYVKLLMNNNNEEQLNFNINYKFNNNIFYLIELNNNIKYNKITLFTFGIGYEDNCYQIIADFKRTDYINSKNKPNISFNLTLKLRTY